jgi:Mg2+-importing ATPase
MSTSSASTAVGFTGLTSDQAAESLKRFGPNELATTKRYSLVADLWHSLANPLTAVLLIAAAVSGFLGQRIDAAIIATMVALSTVIDLAQTHRSLSAMDKLRAQVSTTATVLRDGDWKEIFGASSSPATSFGFRPVTSFPLTHA